ncbi:MAG: stage V sporulation protein AC [Eubacteriales Family XIII. Incertae Sedis bacterium]|nr:MAG: stage V sporulation protein AC [Clostridiales Family XIII bacterium]
MSTNRNGKTSGGSGAKTIQKKEVAKAYEKYAEKFTPKPTYLKNCIIAFIVGGLICMAALYVKNRLTAGGIGEEDAGTFVTMMLVCTAQLLTGFGWFDTIGKVCGAGVIVPITGFANSMVAPAIEYKKEGIVLGVGSKLFSLAGPVLACGISAATVVGIIYWAMDKF